MTDSHFYKYSKCKVEKTYDNSHKDKRRKSGLNSWCKTCVKERGRKKYYKDLEQLREYQRNWKRKLKEDNPTHYIKLISTSNKNYREKYPERVKKYKKAYENLSNGKLNNVVSCCIICNKLELDNE